MTYADYTYYTDEYKGSLSNDLFSSFIIKASKEIDRNVNTVLTDEIIEALTEKQQDDLKYVACSLTDFMNANKTTAYQSLSIDGVSKTVKANDVLKKEKVDILDNLPQCLTRYI